MSIGFAFPVCASDQSLARFVPASSLRSSNARIVRTQGGDYLRRDGIVTRASLSQFVPASSPRSSNARMVRPQGGDSLRKDDSVTRASLSPIFLGLLASQL